MHDPNAAEPSALSRAVTAGRTTKKAKRYRSATLHKHPVGLERSKQVHPDRPIKAVLAEDLEGKEKSCICNVSYVAMAFIRL